MRWKSVILILGIVLTISSLYGKSVENGIKTVVIDPGHGGKDPGAVVGKAREKAIVLDISLRLGNHIKKNLSDVKVVYTRDKDYFVPLFERAQIANRNNADLFISIHANYCGSPSVKGTETYVLGLHRTQDNLDVAKKENSVILLEEDYTTRYEGFDPNLSESYIMFELIQDNYIEQSVTFAGMIQDQFRTQAQRADRDVRQAGFLVLRETAMPSVLVEAGYLSNKSENAYLLTENGREQIAYAIYQSLFNYKTKFELRLNQGSSAKTTKNDSGSISNNIQKSVKDSLEPSAKKSIQSESKKVESKIESSIAKEEGTFAIQVASSRVKIPLSSSTFKGIKDIKELPVKGTYKYLCYESAEFPEVKSHLAEIRKKIPGAFIVAIKEGITRPANEVTNKK